MILLQGGMAAGRRLEFVDMKEEIIDRAPESALFFAVGLSFAPEHKNPEFGLNH
ncbi:MAG: hypothetical protein KIPDCIKN_04391 [Haliscomenobacter sp.]|nr:hypothetical protein [Haliscomenobacter sp.]